MNGIALNMDCKFLIHFTDGNVTLQAGSQECFLFLGSDKCSHAGTSFFVFAFCIQSLVSSEFNPQKIKSTKYNEETVLTYR